MSKLLQEFEDKTQRCVEEKVEEKDWREKCIDF